MAKDYDIKTIEKKWQNYWYNNHVFEVSEDNKKPKFYALIEFPYPSGSGLHLGHIKAYSSMEVIARKKRLQGYNVLFPIGFDAFGLPTENYAMRTKHHPRVVTDENIDRFSGQIKRIGYSFCWDRVVDTTDPDFYKWTQWIFLKLFEKGLAYKSYSYVNFCPDCKVVLANEESQNGICDRCGSEVVQKEKDVWFLKIRSYAEKLLEGLDTVNFPERIRTEQENWIGKSVGAEIIFKVTCVHNEYPLIVYTTRPDTIYGATFLVISPEHPLVEKYSKEITNISEINNYCKEAKTKKEFERIHMLKDKTGVRIDGLYATNPISGARIPIFIADYVMMGYGSGAIMAVPAHDQRDWEFAKKFDLPIIEVISGGDIEKEAYTTKADGVLINSPEINGLSVKEAIKKMIVILEKKGVGVPKTDYKMKDWAFNRQRYWGEPIPIINCPHCGQVPVPDNELPILLPHLDDITPTDDASSPLSKCTEWVNTKCPICGCDALRETDTMPQWAGSSWYFLRYMSPRDKSFAVNPKSYKYWGQVDWYNGGMEHVTRHLIYSRFWNNFLFDIGVVSNKEPYLRRSAQGLILGSDGEKMSKARGNTIDPIDIVDAHGADILRLFILFLGDYEKPAPWQSEGIKGCVRFLNRVWNLQDMIREGDSSDLNIDVLIKKVDDDYESVKFNTAIAALMTAVNTIYLRGFITFNEFKVLLILLYPVAPHMTSELYSIITGALINEASFPKYDETNLISDTIEIPVQVFGKLKCRVSVPLNSDEATVIDAISETGLLTGKTLKKSIYVKNRIINLILE
ncbi:MAG: leucine--tRNA ligase [Christensenellaceae bacterium]|jgi:leucyl-tRNA synthetase|nr:leucine--tRNA ligase [Christensenellaceae bacterium]